VFRALVAGVRPCLACLLQGLRSLESCLFLAPSFLRVAEPWPSSGPDVAPDAGDRLESRSGLGRPRRAAIPAMVRESPPCVVRRRRMPSAPARPVTREAAVYDCRDG
jgi:hypothetical protein